MLDNLLFLCSSEEMEGLIYTLVVTGVLAISLLLAMVEVLVAVDEVVESY